jgi:transketolase
MPGLVTLRPADAIETLQAWKVALGRSHGPTALVLIRQNVPNLYLSESASDGVERGGYILWETGGAPKAILIASGSEVQLTLEAGKLLQNKGIAARVVSLPSWQLFDAQPAEYRNRILPAEVRVRVSVEAGSPLGWERYVGLDGITIGVSQFGKSAPGELVYKQMGFTAQHVFEEALKLLGGPD